MKITRSPLFLNKSDVRLYKINAECSLNIMNVNERPEEAPMKFQFLVRFCKKHEINAIAEYF